MKKVILLIYVFILHACFWGGDFHKKINERYYLYATDYQMDWLHIGYNDGEYGVSVIDSKIIAIGYNDEFIIAKQYPKKDINNYHLNFIDTTITNYFIIPLTDKGKVNNYYAKNLYGPMSLSEFQDKKKELGISALEFSFFNNK